MRWLTISLGLLVCATSGPISISAERSQEPLSGARATMVGDWVHFEVGADETAHEIQVRVWGSLRDASFFAHGFQQLDTDPEMEYVIISRNAGTGPYYKLQIIDQVPNGILTWSYDSYGRPRIAGTSVDLGVPPQGSRPSVSARYHLTPRGLEPGAQQPLR